MTKTNHLVHTATATANGEFIKVKIRLNDECKNGHQDFAITATIWEAEKPLTDRNMISGGCCHDDILKHFPEFKIFVDLNLCDYSGSPLHATANGFYHLSNDMSKERFIEYYRMTEEQFNIVSKAEEVSHYAYLLKKTDVRKNWLKQATKGIETLEELTGKKFLNDSKRSQFVELTIPEEVKVEERIKEGYYTTESREDRKEKKETFERSEAIRSIKESAQKDIDKINKELSVKLYLFSYGLNTEIIDNTIYYSHSNELKFNWLDYKKKISEKDFNKFCKEFDSSKLPNITLVLEGVKQYTNK